MADKLKVVTVVGTRPEIIRLSATIALLDAQVDHVLVHTGQNYDYELNQVFFEDLGLQPPAHVLQADTTSLASTLGSVLVGTESVLTTESPDAFLVLGDTNSAISAVIARRMRVPVFHMEAGNRSFDENVPEETNRRLVDHVSDYNLVYTEHARRNLLAEGIHPSRVVLTGSPMREVLDRNRTGIESSDVLDREGLHAGEYVLVSLHREENVDDASRLRAALASLQAVHEELGVPVLVSTHPRTRKRLDALGGSDMPGIVFHTPFGFHDYVRLQVDARVVLSDSGTISEEASLLGFPAVTLRDQIERPEALDAGAIVTAGVDVGPVMQAVRLALATPRGDLPAGYEVRDTSHRVVRFLISATHGHRHRAGLRERPSS